jgi:hypothetical protein
LPSAGEGSAALGKFVELWGVAVDGRDQLVELRRTRIETRLDRVETLADHLELAIAIPENARDIG